MKKIKIKTVSNKGAILLRFEMKYIKKWIIFLCIPP